MVDFHKQVLKCSLGLQTKIDALEALRTDLVYSMRTGCCFVINVDTTAPDFVKTYTHDKVFPT